MIRLDGKAVAITGAGRGLGNAYARLFADRGAQVVVNDLGTSGEGHGNDASVAENAAAQIRAAGGTAIADTHDVSTQEGGAALVERTLDEFGRIDVLVHNAGIITSKPFTETTSTDFTQYMQSHLMGLVATAQAAWPAMQRQKTGRIIATESSAGLYGLAGQATYAAAKGAVHGLMRTLALEGAEHGILVNAIEPGGYSRMHSAAISDEAQLEVMRRTMSPDLVAPVVVWLGSDDCAVTGQTFTTRSGLVVKIAIGFGEGFFAPELTPESVAANYDSIASVNGFYEPTDVIDGLTHTNSSPQFRAAYADVLAAIGE
ncbi:SDR family NAD(P)-dependent oxidoreductase [Streptomyces sp. NPDC097610]|uniref:SDR family NAD(P)-dependent oxidoreductase n=1 Tax=Streptomyces sp. NPDC097610 TaxID=3157227 RepID=UPI0033238AEF